MTAGNRVFWPNRKSKHGMQRSSKTPYRHDARVFVTTPPIAEDPMLDLKSLGVSEVDALKAELERMREENRALQTKLDVHERVQTVLDEAKAWSAKGDELAENAKQVLAEAKAAHANSIATLKQARKENDPETIALKVMYGVEEAMKEHAQEVAKLKSIIGERDSEIAELKRSKKRLREAIERLSRST